MPTTVRAHAPISLPLSDCWTRLRDLTRAKHYVPGLTDTVITTEALEGVGASRVVTHAQFGAMDETVIEWNEGTGFSVRLHKGDKPARPFKEASFTYALRPAPGAPADGCEIHTAMTYTLPFGALGRIVGDALLGRVFRRNVLDTATCLAEHYHTGRPVPAEDVARVRGNGQID